jgi:hypothetical protein
MRRHHHAVATIALTIGALVASGSAASLAASAAPSPVSSPTFLCSDETTNCAGPLSLGDHATAHFDRPFTFTLPDGWTNGNDRYRAYELTSSKAPDSEFIVWSHAAPEAQTPDCSPAREPGFGTTTEEWLRFLASRPGLEVTEPTTTDLGGRTLTSVEVTVKPTWTALCFDNTSPAVLLVTDTEDPPTRGKLVAADGQGYLGFVDVGGETVVIWVDGAKGAPFADMLALAKPVIESIRFTDTATSSPAAP